MPLRVFTCLHVGNSQPFSRGAKERVCVGFLHDEGFLTLMVCRSCMKMIGRMQWGGGGGGGGAILVRAI